MTKPEKRLFFFSLSGPFFRNAAALLVIVLSTGCATPTVHPADPRQLFTSEWLSFLVDGLTTREQVVFRLGIPSAQVEGERILMYQLKADEKGNWHLVAPQWNAGAGLRAWSPGTASLVLVFDSDGVLHQHNLVTAQ